MSTTGVSYVVAYLTYLIGCREDDDGGGSETLPSYYQGRIDEYCILHAITQEMYPDLDLSLNSV